MILTLVLVLVPIGGFLYIIYYPPKALFDFMQARHPDVLYHLPLPDDQKIVALTIDDCPSIHTPAILDSLYKHSAHATFFVIGDQVTPALSPLLPRMIAEGHEVGNHAWSDEKTVLRPLPEVERQIRAVENLLPENKNGKRYFRPGGGFYSSMMVERVKAMGYRTALGCIYPHDPQISSARANASHVLKMVRPGGIIILHDRRLHSAPQLELVLKGLKAGGWDVVNLSELIAIHEKISGSKND